MSKRARSARGELVDFDLLSIKMQLATAPVPVGVQDRRRFIDEKDGIRTKQVQAQPAPDAVPSALSMSVDAAAESEAAAE